MRCLENFNKSYAQIDSEIGLLKQEGLSDCLKKRKTTSLVTDLNVSVSSLDFYF